MYSGDIRGARGAKDQTSTCGLVLCGVQIETVVTWPVETVVDPTVTERMESMIQMEIENDGTMLMLGELSPAKVLLTYPNVSERRLGQWPVSGTIHVRLHHRWL